MDAEKELLESLEYVGEIERDILGSKSTLDGYIEKLEKEIVKMSANNQAEQEDRQHRVILVSKLCALSELYSVINFDRMIEAREMFIDLFPDHFHSYLNYLESATISSNLLYGCLGCLNYKGECQLNLNPPSESHSERCPSRQPYITC